MKKLSLLFLIPGAKMLACKSIFAKRGISAKPKGKSPWGAQSKGIKPRSLLRNAPQARGQGLPWGLIPFTFCIVIILSGCVAETATQMFERQIKSLSPSEIGEFESPVGVDHEDYPGYQPDPKGKHYNFWSFSTEGCSVFCAILGYEVKVNATSTLPQINNTKYEPENLLNPIRDVVWCEGVKGHGVGERINMSIKLRAHFVGQEDNCYFPELMIVNGHARTDTAWKNNSRVKALRLYVNGEPWRDLHLEDTIKPQIFTFAKGEEIYPTRSGKKISVPDWENENDGPNVATYQTDFSFEIIEVYPGAKYDDTCITGIIFNVYVPNH